MSAVRKIKRLRERPDAWAAARAFDAHAEITKKNDRLRAAHLAELAARPEAPVVELAGRKVAVPAEVERLRRHHVATRTLRGKDRVPGPNSLPATMKALIKWNGSLLKGVK